MRYQIRLIDQNLPGLTREIALACWRAVDGLVSERLGSGVYRSLYRSLRSVLKGRVHAFRYCGAARMCEHTLPKGELARTPAHERYPAEHVHVYLTDPETSPEALVGELLHQSLHVATSRLPGRRLKVLAEILKHQIEKTLEGRMFPSVFCGDQTLCHANEPYDPWDLSDPINAVQRSA